MYEIDSYSELLRTRCRIKSFLSRETNGHNQSQSENIKESNNLTCVNFLEEEFDLQGDLGVRERHSGISTLI